MSATPLLRVERVSKVFRAGPALVRAVDDVSFETHAGEVTLVMGPSGSGKTTLLSMVGGILRPTSGRIAIAGLELTGLRRRELPRVRRELVGFVFQTFNLLESLSALENVEIALNIAGVAGDEARRRAEALLCEAGLGARLRFAAGDLSAGERQRVALARALANEPRLLLADEPTANLDSAAGRQVMELLRRLTGSRGHAAVVVSHDLRLREVADRVLQLADGRLVPPEDGGLRASTDRIGAYPDGGPAVRGDPPARSTRDQVYQGGAMDRGTHRCSVYGCPNLAAYEVMLYDFDPAEGAVIFSEDESCPTICVEHAIDNERGAVGERLPHRVVAYPFTNRAGRPGIAVYLQTEPVMA